MISQECQTLERMETDEDRKVTDGEAGDGEGKDECRDI